MRPLPPASDQAEYWDRWNVQTREVKVHGASARQGAEVEARVAAIGRRDLKILDVGCGTGWLCERLLPYGTVTGTDMTPSTLQRASLRLPSVQFRCGDFFDIQLPERHFDVVVSLEVLAHVQDQMAFLRRLLSLLRPGGVLLLSTQNRFVFERWSAIPPPDPAQIRRWVDHNELKSMLRQMFEQVDVRSLHPVGDRGLLRIVNSVKVNRALGCVVGAARLQGWKERWMLGNTLLASCTRPT